jgi:hypothetical protein
MVTVQPAAKPVPVKVRAVADLVPPVAGATVVKVEVEAGTRPATAVSWLVTRVCSAVHLFLNDPLVPVPGLRLAVLAEQSVRLALAGGDVLGASGKGTGLIGTPVGWVTVPPGEVLYPLPSWGAVF